MVLPFDVKGITCDFIRLQLRSPDTLIELFVSRKIGRILFFSKPSKMIYI